MSLGTLVVLYAAFAALATLANLGTQHLLLGAPLSAGLGVAMIGGTLVGLVVKYVLDKRWIFADTSSGMRSHGRKFTLYSSMGVVTTAIFWATETTFWLVWHTDAMRDAGAVLGLAVGYYVKYRLDRRFVFTDRQLVAA